MSTPIQPLTLLVVAIAGWLQRDQQAAMVYLLEENRVLKARLRYPAVAPASILGLAGGLFSAVAWPGQRPLPYLAQTWHSKIAIRDESRK